MKKQYFRFLALTLAFIIGGWGLVGAIHPQDVSAQGNDLNAILARATVKGYIISLKQSSSRSSTLSNFYLGEDIAQSAIVQELSQRQVTGFEITDEGWLREGTYQVKIAIQPDEVILVADVSNVSNRWQIINLAWDQPASITEGAATTSGTLLTTEDTSTADSMSDEATATTPDDTTEATAEMTSEATETATADAMTEGTDETPAAPSDGTSMATDDTPEMTGTEDTMAATSTGATGSMPTAEVLSFGLSIRSGPGFEYPVIAYLTQGQVVELVATNAARRWYQIAQEGQVVGWISAKLDYIAPSAGAENVPVISTTSPPSAESEATGTADVSTATTNDAPTTTMTDASPTAQIVSFGLNIRSGPGIAYSILGRLTRDEVVEVVGKNAAGGWYQVARAGEIIGWISSKPAYVTSSAGAANVPVVPAPPIPGTSNKTSNAPAPSVSTPAIPATGGTIILQEKSGGNFYLVDRNRGTLQHIASGIDPVLSPDGTKVAFTRWNTNIGGEGSLWIYDLTAGTERLVLGETRQAKSPAWSPDGSQIMVSFQQGGQPQIEEYCKDRGERITPGAYDINIGSETGRICYKLPADPHWHLRLIDVATGTYQDMASATYSKAPTWDPVQDWRIIFAESFGLQQLDVKRDVYFPFTTDLRDRGPVISPDGQMVAVTYKQHNHWEVYTISTTNGNRSRLTKTPILGQPFNSAAPAWSPDSKELVFVTDRTGQWEFWIMNVDGSNPRPFLSPELAAQIPVEYNGVDERLISWVQ